MKYTFAEAQRRLTPYTGSFGTRDPAEAINTAIEALASSKNWIDMTRLVRMTTVNEYFALPQEYLRIERAAVNGTPVSMKTSDYEFLHSGPGDLDYLPEGYAILQNGAQDLGSFPTMYAPDRVEKLCAFSTVVPSGKIRIRGRNEEGDLVTETIAVNSWTGQDDIDTQDTASVTQTVAEFATIDELTLPTDASAYISIYGISEEAFFFLSRMHPGHRAAEFRRYRLPVFNSNVEDESHHILAEVRMQFVPLVDDDDILPFDTLLPVQYMLQSLAYAEAQEVETSAKYRAMAMSHLTVKEDNKHTAQGIRVVNELYDESLGYASDHFYDNL